MRRWALSDLALDRPVTIGMLLVAVVLLGAIALTRLPLSFLPSDNASRVYVRANVTSTSPEIIERTVVRPLEGEVAGLRDLQRIQVGTGSWGVRMNLEFAPGTDVAARKIELRERIERVRGELPDSVQDIEIGTYTNMDDPVMELRISADSALSQDYYLIEQRIIRPIERVPGVSRVELEGLRPEELEVAVDLEAVDRVDASLQHLGSVVRSAHRNHALGLLRRSDEDTGVRSPGLVPEPAAYERLPVQRATTTTTATTSTPSNASLVGVVTPAPRELTRVGELASVTLHPEEDRRRSRMDGRTALNLEVFGTAGASAVDVSKAVRETLAELREDSAVGDIDVVVFHDQGEMILQTLGDLRNTGIYGGALGVLVLFAFLRRIRPTLIAASAIPLSVLVTCAVMLVRGDELNCLALLGLVLGVGMLIDNAVVMVEAIEVQTRQGHGSELAARYGAHEVGLATLAATMSTVIVFLPLIVGNPADPMSAYLKPLGITFSISLLASLFISQMAVPLFMGRLLPAKAVAARAETLGWFGRGYVWIVRHSLAWPKTTMLLGSLIAATAAVPMTQANLRLGDVDFKPDFLPIRLQIEGENGYDRVQAIVERVERELLPHKQALGIEHLACSYHDWGGHCRAYPSEPIESEAEMEAYQAKIAAALPEQPHVVYRLGERDFSWGDNRDRNVVEFALKGEDMAILLELSKQAAEHLRQRLRKGNADHPEDGGYDIVLSPFEEGSKELQVTLERDRLQHFGLAPEDVANQVTLAFQGINVGRVRGSEGEISIRLSVRADDETSPQSANEPGLDDLRDLPLALADGNSVPLGAIARLEIVGSPHWVQRVDRQTEVRVSVRFFSDDKDANNAAVEAAMADFRLPPGHTRGDGTRWRGEREAGNEMLINLGLCLVLVYAVMASLFETFLQPLVILLTCVLGCFGAPWAMWLSNTTVDTTALIGLFILIGIVVNNGIMLIDKVVQLRAGGYARDEALLQACRDRLRPIAMTATTTVLGLVPMLLHHPTLAGVYYHAIAIVVAGGLATSTITTLLFLPAAYKVAENLALAARTEMRGITRARGT